MSAHSWIAVDWGTTHLRAFAMDGRSVVAQFSSDRGMGTLSASEFENALLDVIGPWLDRPTPVLACGMVGSRQGWVEARYLPVPCKPLSESFTEAPTKDTRLRVWIVPGLSQASPPDVMRGEETQIAGFLSLNPGWDGVICLPGSHTKWAHISAGEVISFQTVMTGEMLAALSGSTVLRHSMAPTGWDEKVFLDTLDQTRSRPETLATQLFRTRATDLLHGLDPVAARSRIIGALIGAELAATRPYWLGQPIAVIGATEPSRGYLAGLRAQGAAPIEADGDAMTRAGLSVAHSKLMETA
ncbi:MAG: 2-dehydro-3-deoxygalactonokinase [Pseudomonadota bacterium]